MPRMSALFLSLMLLGAGALVAAPPLPALDQAAPHDEVAAPAYNLTATWDALPKGAEASLIFDHRAAEDFRLLRVSTARTQLLTAQGARLVPLVSGSGLPPGQGASLTLTVLRRPGSIRVYAGPTLLVQAYVTTPGGGACGVASGSAAKPTDLFVQEVGDIDLEDDFFAGDERDDAWKMLVGKFRIDVYWDPKQKLDSRPIGASWFANAGPGDHLAVAGEDYWDDTASEVSVLPAPGCTVGLAARVHDAGNYVALTLSAPPDGAETVAKLIESVDGKPRTLAEKRGPWPPGRWHRLRVEVAGQRALGLVDGDTIGEGRTSGWPCGPVGLLMSGQGDCRFDDLAVHGLRRLDAVAQSAPAGPWTFPSGAWQATGAKLSCRAASTAVAVASAGSWQDCDLQATVTPGPQSPAGLLARWGDAGGYALLVRPDGKDLLCTIASLAPQSDPSILAQGRVPAGGQAAQLRLVADGAALRGFVDGQCVAKAWDGRYTEGAVGLVATAGTAAFSGFRAAAPPLREAVTVLVEDGTGRTRPGAEHGLFERFLGDLWRPLGGSPQPTELGGEPCFALRNGALRFYSPRPGEVSVSVDVLRCDDKAVGLVICSQPQAQSSGYRFALTNDQLTLTRDGEVVKTESLGSKPATPQHLSLSRDGPYVIGQCGQAVIANCDPKPLDSGYALVRVDGEATLDNLLLGADHALSYPFGRVEPDWMPASGDWAFHSGMACIPWAYWLTGDGRQQPAFTWCRRLAPSDVAVSFDVSEYTEGYENDDHQHFPYHDISLVLAAPEQKPDSGYRFVIGAEGGRLLRLYRNGELVKEINDPRFAIAMNYHCNTPRAIEVSASKHGGALRLVLQGVPALNYDDPLPLGAGFVGLGVANCRANYRDLFLCRDYTWELPVGAAGLSVP